MDLYWTEPVVIMSNMSRRSTLPEPWLNLANAVGGLVALRAALGWPYMVFYRRARGLVKIPKTDQIVIAQLAKQHHVMSPLTEDVSQLEFFGEALALGMPPSQNETVRLKSIYSTEQLVQLAESETASVNALRAATHLLDL